LGRPASGAPVASAVFDHELEHVNELNDHLDIDHLDIDDGTNLAVSRLLIIFEG